MTNTEEIKRLAAIVRTELYIEDHWTQDEYEQLTEEIAKVVLKSYLPSPALVRPLVWEEGLQFVDFKSVTPVATYYVSKDIYGKWIFRCRIRNTDTEEWHNTEDEAKQAAQNHFNTLISSCLQGGGYTEEQVKKAFQDGKSEGESYIPGFGYENESMTADDYIKSLKHQ